MTITRSMFHIFKCLGFFKYSCVQVIIFFFFECSDVFISFDFPPSIFVLSLFYRVNHCLCKYVVLKKELVFGPKAICFIFGIFKVFEVLYTQYRHLPRKIQPNDRKQPECFRKRNGEFSLQCIASGSFSALACNHLNCCWISTDICKTCLSTV